MNILTLNLLILLVLVTLQFRVYASTYIVNVHPNATFERIPYGITRHRYKNVISGFAVKLTKDELSGLKKEEWFVSAQQETSYELQTTYTPSFLGLGVNGGAWVDSNFGKGVIIGMLDTGIAFDHPSFIDRGMSPPPAKWKGVCQFNQPKACNNKLIGARFFETEDGSQLDLIGHGSHTSSIAGGNFVDFANIYGNAMGTASGIAPLAHIAIYKVCSLQGCKESDILAGFEAAIDDGVDIISVSIVLRHASAFHEDTIALGAYRAAQKGIFVSCAAGNAGPSYQTLLNDTPWILTVGASTIDRDVRVRVRLGSGETLIGQSAYRPDGFPIDQMFLVAYTANSTGFNPSYCATGSLRNTNVTGKVVVCEHGIVGHDQKARTVRDAGGVGMIVTNQQQDGYTTFAEVTVVPATHLSYKESLALKAYLSSTTSPTATFIFDGTLMGDANAPVVGAFSSRGPSLNCPGILKPDVIGPGVNVLAAWPSAIESSTPTSFNMMSGTSMACPHLSGVAALIKSLHPEWSPATIKSALLTTADQHNIRGDSIEDQNFVPSNVFEMGAGHVNPFKASNPGLIYDIDVNDYVQFLCGLNYTNYQVSIIVGREIDCENESRIVEQELNYPTFSIKVVGRTSQTYTRTLTNVGDPVEYKVEIASPAGLDIKVEPSVLSFSQLNEKRSYNITFSISTTEKAKQMVSQGYIAWKSPKHSVKSVVAVQFDRFLYKNGIGMSTSLYAVVLRFCLTSLVCLVLYQ